MSNPLRILRTLDRHLTLPAEITLFGRSALALGFSEAPVRFHNTQDVDGILPLAWLRPPDAHQDFWQAVERTNIELEPGGLYLTHLFREVDVILQPDWLDRRLRLEVGLPKLAVFRPATIDLILTKMARADDDDLAGHPISASAGTFDSGPVADGLCKRPCAGRAGNSRIIQSRPFQGARLGCIVSGALVQP